MRLVINGATKSDCIFAAVAVVLLILRCSPILTRLFPRISLKSQSS